MDQEAANAQIAQVDDAISQAEALASSVSDPTLRTEIVSFTAILRRAFVAWSTTQLAEVLAGTRTEDNWTHYGTGTTGDGSLLEQAQRFIRDNGSVYAQWSKSALAVGSAAEDVVTFVTEHVQDWRTALDGYKTSMAAFDAQEQATERIAQVFQPWMTQLPQEAQQLLYGEDAQTAANKLSLLHTAIVLAEKILSALEAGATAVLGDGDVQLGNPLVVTGGVAVAGLVGLLALIGGVVAWLFSYYQHVDQVTQSDEVKALLDASKNPNISRGAADKLAAAAADLSHHKPPDPMDSFGSLLDKIATDAEKLGKTLLVVGGLAAGGYAVWHFWPEIKAFFDGLFKKRRANPRRRRRNGHRRRRARA